MNTEVVIRAAGIDVTASDESQALSYLREDGAQFRSAWEYELNDAYPTEDEPTDADDVRIEAETSEPEGRGERTWNGDVLFTVVIEGEHDGDEALELARAVVVGG